MPNAPPELPLASSDDDGPGPRPQEPAMAPGNPTFRRQLASALANMSRIDEAGTALEDYQRLEPTHTLADAAKVPSSVAELVARFVEGLRLAKLPT